MNFKIFSIVVAVFIAIIAIFSGVYYYFFSFSKPQNYTFSPPSSSKTHTKPYDESYLADQINLEYDLNKNGDDKQELSLLQENQNLENNTSVLNDENKQNLKEQRASKTLDQQSKEEKIFKTQKAVKLQAKQTKKSKKISALEEYLSMGKNSRLEPELSTANMKVYILEGKFLSQYRINLLKDILSAIENNAKDYHLSVFIKMLPKDKMKISIYNREIIFSERKKAYKYINLKDLSPYLNKPEELNQKLKREEILKRFQIQTQKEQKGSEFSKHIKSLKAGLDKAQYFFPFCEIVEISSL